MPNPFITFITLLVLVVGALGALILLSHYIKALQMIALLFSKEKFYNFTKPQADQINATSFRNIAKGMLTACGLLLIARFFVDDFLFEVFAINCLLLSIFFYLPSLLTQKQFQKYKETIGIQQTETARYSLLTVYTVLILMTLLFLSFGLNEGFYFADDISKSAAPELSYIGIIFFPIFVFCLPLAFYTHLRRTRG